MCKEKNEKKYIFAVRNTIKTTHQTTLTMDLNSILGVLAAGNTANEIGQKFNIDSKQVSSVITSALPTLIGAMQKNASTESGASALAKALTDHAGDSTFNLGKVDMTDGSKILSHILGNNSSSIFSALAKQTGTNSNQVSTILAAIAPTLLGLLGKGKQANNTGALSGMLGSLLGGSSSSGMGSLLGAAMADRDGDGKPDILGGLGSLFKK